MRLGGTVVAALWYALVTGLAELAWKAFRMWRGDMSYQGRQMVWMTPLADACLFLAVAALASVVLRVARRPGDTRAVHAVLAVLAGTSVLATQSRLAWWAVLALALGAGVRWAALVASRPALVATWQRRTLVPLLLVPVLLAVAVNLRLHRQERAALERLPAAPAGAPSVLLIVWDAVRAGNTSAHGYDRRTTPTLESLAVRGVTFDHAIATSSWTLPSHVSLFTGRWAHQTRAGWSAPMETDIPTLAEALAARGWRTGAFSGNIYFVGWEHGVLRGFSRTEDHRFSFQELAQSSMFVRWTTGFAPVRRLLDWHDKAGRVYAPALNRGFLRWLDRDPERPFFAFLNYYDAHDPYLPRAPYDSLFGSLVTASPAARARAARHNGANKFDLTSAEIADLEALYDGAIAMLDADVGALLEELRRRGRLDNPLIIVTAAHGEQFGEHRTFGHGNDVYIEAVHVPFVAALPRGRLAGTRVRGAVSLRDVPATIADVLGVGGDAWPLPGRSLLERVAAGAVGETVLTEVDRIPRGSQPWYPVRRGDVRSILAWPHHLITTADSVELYDLERDPGERADLAALAAYAPVRDTLLDALRRLRADAVPLKR